MASVQKVLKTKSRLCNKNKCRDLVFVIDTFWSKNNSILHPVADTARESCKLCANNFADHVRIQVIDCGTGSITSSRMLRARARGRAREKK